jgi:hypothetical protein
MSAVPPAIRRLCLAVDIVAYSGRSRAEQIDVQTRLLWTMVQGCQVAGVSPARCDRQDSGDGQILILPPGIDEARVIPDLVGGLLTALHRVNNPVGPGRRIRLRVSMGQGAIQIGQTGFIAPAVVTVCRLLDSDVLRDAIRAKPDSDAALIVTSDLYDDMFGQGYGGLPASGFIRVSVDKPEKGFAADAWLQVPDAGPLLAAVPDYREPADLKRGQESLIQVLDSQGVQAGDNNVQVNLFPDERPRGGVLVPVMAATALAWAVFAGGGGAGHAPGPADVADAAAPHDGTHDGGLQAVDHDAPGHSPVPWDADGTGPPDDLALDGIGDHDAQHHLGLHDGLFGTGGDADDPLSGSGYDDPATDSAGYADSTGYEETSGGGTVTYHPWDDGGASDHAPGHWGGTY